MRLPGVGKEKGKGKGKGCERSVVGFWKERFCLLGFWEGKRFGVGWIGVVSICLLFLLF